MSTETDVDGLTLPVKRTDGETLEERLTSNAYNNILPARYLRKDADGNLTETQQELFARAVITWLDHQPVPQSGRGRLLTIAFRVVTV